MVFVDGFEIGDAEHVVLRDRQQLAGDGILIAVVTVNAQTGETVAPPELVARGFLHDEEHEHDLLAEARDDPGRAPRTSSPTNTPPVSGCCARTSTTRSPQFIYRRTKREPLIMPVVVEV